jgi:Holliday junction resolvase
MTEREFQREILKLAKLLGWRYYHTYDSRRSNKGFPDLVLVKGERVIFAELKSEKGKVKPEQVEWLEAIDNTPAEAYLWRPSELQRVADILIA